MADNLPKTCRTHFEDVNRLASFILIITPDEGYWLGGKFKFLIEVPEDYNIEVCSHFVFIASCYILYFIFVLLKTKKGLMVRWVVGSIIHGVDPLSYYLFQPVFHDWCNKGHGRCYPVCGMVHINEPLLLIERSSPCGGNRFPLLLSEWSFTICLMPCNRK